MNMSLVIMEVKYVAFDTDDSSFHGYYIIKFSSSLYTLQADLIIDRKVISSGELVREKFPPLQSILTLVVVFHKERNH